MQEKKYAPFTNEEIIQAFQSGDTREISQTLVTLALYASEWKPVEQYCLEFLEYPDAGVRKVAATCLGHLARLHQQLDLDRVLPALYKHFDDPGEYVAGAANDALDDIEIFMKVPVRHLEATQNEEINVELEEDDDEDERPLTSAEVEQAIQSGNALEIEKMLVALTYHDPDWQRAETYCLHFLDHPDESVRGTAVDCLYHLAFEYKTLHFDRVLPALYRHRSDASKYVANKVENALKYIQTYLHIPIEAPALTQDMHSTQVPSQAQTGESPTAKKGDMRTRYDSAHLTFLADPLAYQCKAEEVCILVPGTLSTPKELIDLLTTKLDLLPYDGDNWSALSEVLSSWDEWRVTPQRVVLLHHDLPFMQEGENGWKQQKLYLTVLLRSIVKIQEKNTTRPSFEGPRALVAIFPRTMENDLRTLIVRSVTKTQD